MKCDKCDNEATVHEVSIKGGKRHEKHLCEKCARGEGVNIAPGGPAVSPVLQTFIAVKPTPETGQAGAGGACAACGTTFAQFRSTGVLGCPQCYAAFEAQLTPLLSRAHEGGTHHVGKSPVSVTVSGGVAGLAAVHGTAGVPGVAGVSTTAASKASVEQRVETLRKSLADAVAAEQYEKAAKLRDELHRLQQQPSKNEPLSRRRGSEDRA